MLMLDVICLAGFCLLSLDAAGCLQSVCVDSICLATVLVNSLERVSRSDHGLVEVAMPS